MKIPSIQQIRVNLASPEIITSWSSGEVLNAKTVDPRTTKPEKGGLFCETVFGPVQDYECTCGKLKGKKHTGKVCDKCNVEITTSAVRRRRMGHVTLCVPVAHPWYAFKTPIMGLLLGLSRKQLTSILYSKVYLVTQVDEAQKAKILESLEDSVTEWDSNDKSFSKESVQHEIDKLKQQRSSELLEVIRKTRSKSKKKNPVLSDQDLVAIYEHYEARIQELTQQIESPDNGLIGLLESVEMGETLSQKEMFELKRSFGSFFTAETGGEGVFRILQDIDLDMLHRTLKEDIEACDTEDDARKKRLIKRLDVVESFITSANRPEWMMLRVLPIHPPDMRPILFLENGKIASSDTNNLYRRVINRNNRLKNLIEAGAPEAILVNEKRMLQKAIRELMLDGANIDGVDHKSLSDNLSGKKGRFRQNLLGKRVDYSGRSVIVSGPQLKLHQCGLPRHAALELYKPFVISHMVERFKIPMNKAKQLIRTRDAKAYDALDVVVRKRPVILNRAPSLHTLSMQAFEPVLIDGNAVQLHPLVTSAFNADFDGDQMGIHLPVSEIASKEVRALMISTRNVLRPSSGDPIISPSKDMVLGLYYLTMEMTGDQKVPDSRPTHFDSVEELELALYHKKVEIHDVIMFHTNTFYDNNDERISKSRSDVIKTTVGRVLFNSLLPPEIRFKNITVNKGKVQNILEEVFDVCGRKEMVITADTIKDVGFKFATLSGISLVMGDITIPETKDGIIAEGQEMVKKLKAAARRGLLTSEELDEQTIETWTDINAKIGKEVQKSMSPNGNLSIMADSGASKGGLTPITQLAGMRGLMADPAGRTITLPVTSCLLVGLSMTEYFISTHGARKGLADTALRTADAGYLTRRLIDVAHDVIVVDIDCQTRNGITVKVDKATVKGKLLGRVTASRVETPDGSEVVLERNELITVKEVKELFDHNVDEVVVRSPLTCDLEQICVCCYGMDMATKDWVRLGSAVGIIAAQSIGEPGTQLTLRTFHSGGIAGDDITAGLPRVEELLEARKPKTSAVITSIEGTVEIIEVEDGAPAQVTVFSTPVIKKEEHKIPKNWSILVQAGDRVSVGQEIACLKNDKKTSMKANQSGVVSLTKTTVVIGKEVSEQKTFTVPRSEKIMVNDGEQVSVGQKLTTGRENPHILLSTLGKNACQEYIIEELLSVYRSQGQNIVDKHVEVILKKMLQFVEVLDPGETDLMTGSVVREKEVLLINQQYKDRAQATYTPVLMGITTAALYSESFLSAASFQNTSNVLANAAVKGKEDRLTGIKENVILGRIIPVGTGYRVETKDI